MSLKLTVVTATTNPERARRCVESWGDVQIVAVTNGVDAERPEWTDGRYTYLVSKDYLGVVPAFRRGVDWTLEHTEADIIACLHDDFEIDEPNWVEKTVRHFETHDACGLAGYGGAIGLGAENIYNVPYNPMQLARVGFRSNLIGAEVHGLRSRLAERVACLDGFSQVGRRDFWRGSSREHPSNELFEVTGLDLGLERPLTYLENHGFVHHFYDGALGCLAARYGWETWYIPLAAEHHGGQTAVGDAGYQAWAKQQIPGGDQGFWEQSHRRGYELFTDVLPLRV